MCSNLVSACQLMKLNEEIRLPVNSKVVNLTTKCASMRLLKPQIFEFLLQKNKGMVYTVNSCSRYDWKNNKKVKKYLNYFQGFALLTLKKEWARYGACNQFKAFHYISFACGLQEYHVSYALRNLKNAALKFTKSTLEMVVQWYYILIQ